jgi:hypothetical protein
MKRKFLCVFPLPKGEHVFSARLSQAVSEAGIPESREGRLRSLSRP